MKSLLVGLFATAAAALATSAAAFDFNGCYLLTFTYPGGSFDHAFQLTYTQQDSGDGYAHSGTWVDTDFPDTSGTWVANMGRIHFLGFVDGPSPIVVDGREGPNTPFNDGTFDYYSSSGDVFAAGTVTFAESTTACSSDSPAKGNFLRND